MQIDMGERTAEKQDRRSLIIKVPLRAPKYPKIYIFLTFWPIDEELALNCFPLLYICLHCDEVCSC